LRAGAKSPQVTRWCSTIFEAKQENANAFGWASHSWESVSLALALWLGSGAKQMNETRKRMTLADFLELRNWKSSLSA
jgi:hypothetical protein